MKTKLAPWNLNNKNVLIFAGKLEEEFALKYGVAICDNEKNIVPCKFMAFYAEDTIRYLFEIDRLPLDNVNASNTSEIKDILEMEKGNGKEWYGDREDCRMFTIKKIADVGPIINDYIAPSTGKLTPLTWGTPRYTTYDRIKKAKLTSELRCVFDEEEWIPPKEEKKKAAPVPAKEKPKSKMPMILTSVFVSILVLITLYFALKPAPEPEVQVKEIVKEVKVKEAPDKILSGNFFAPGRSEIQRQSIPYLKSALAQLNEYKDIKINIVGHTDNVGPEETNLKLSADRAKAVRDWFVSEGIDSTRIAYEGKGSSDPIADNSTEEGRSQNRRTEILVVKDKK